MEYRLGKCASCKAQYRVPATFKADKAKCKKCDGVVEIGPVQGGDEGPADVPATKPPAAKKKPAAAKPRPASPAAKAVAKPAPRAGTPRGGSKDSVRSAAEAAADRVRNAGQKKPGAVRAGAGKDEKSAGRPGSRSSARRTRREPKPKPKKNWGVVIGAIVLLVAGGFGAMYFLKKGDSETRAAENEVAAAEVAVPEEAPVDVPEELPTEEEPVEEAPAEEPEKEPAAPATKDPSSVDLSILPELEQLAETSDEEWAELQQLVATFIDPAAGAAGNRAKKKLLEKGRVAFPAILNQFKKLDVGTQDGYRNGDLVQQLLMDICRGNNFDWHYTTEPADVYFNKRVIELWFKSWGQVVENPKAWIQLGKLTEDEATEYMAKFERVEDIGTSDDLDDF